MKTSHPFACQKPASYCPNQHP